MRAVWLSYFSCQRDVSSEDSTLIDVGSYYCLPVKDTHDMFSVVIIVILGTGEDSRHVRMKLGLMAIAVSSI